MNIAIKNSLLLIISIISVVIIVYWKSILLPFIQDDYSVLRMAQSTDATPLIKSFFSFEQKFFYRPFGLSYIVIMYKIFGLNPVPFHAMALIIHAANSFLIALIINIVTRDRVLGYCSGLIYAASIATQVDTLAWIVGIYDLGGAFCFYFSMWLFLREKLTECAVFYFFGCLFKEAVIILPIILLLYPLIMQPTGSLKESILIQGKRAIPLILTMFVVAGIKLSGESAINQPTTHPYVIDFVGGHLITNLSKYLLWLFQSFFPFLSINLNFLKLIAFGLVVAVVYRISLSLDRRSQETTHRCLVFLSLWLILGFFPVIFFPNHTYRYYATYSLSAFIALVLLMLKVLLLSFGSRERTIAIALACISSLAIIGSAVQGNKIYSEGINQKTYMDGANSLIMRAAMADIVHQGLKQYLPIAPQNASIVIGGDIDLWGAFYKDDGLRVWYDDATLHTYSLSDLKFTDGKPYIDNPLGNQVGLYTNPGNKNLFLDSSRLFVFKISGGQLMPVDLQELAQRKSN